MTTPLPSVTVDRQRGPGERGWKKLVLALVAFVIIPALPYFRAIVPIDETIYLLVPALAACFLVGWWAGGPPLLAAFWVTLATWLMWNRTGSPDAFHNLERGWSLLLAGAFGLACLFGVRRPLFARALAALSIAIFLALAMSAMGPVPFSQARESIATEFVRRNHETMAQANAVITQYSSEWNQWAAQHPTIAASLPRMEQELKGFSRLGLMLFPSLLAFESLIALALAWSIYHRLSRARIGAPLRPLREFRFNDQLVWGLIVGLTIAFLPTLESFRGVGRNLLVFFCALYAIRGLAVLAWFLTPGAGALAAGLVVAVVLLVLPVIGFVAANLVRFCMIIFFGLGLGDTWADWRRRTRSTS
jgi:hypothetical protein